METKLDKKHLLQLLSTIIGINYNESISISNDNYIGFFQWDSSLNNTLPYSEKCLLSVEYFKLFFKEHLDSFIIATSLIVNSKKINKQQNEYLLASKGYILPIDFDIAFDEDVFQEGEDIDQSYNETVSSFRFFSKYHSNDLIDLSFVCMNSDIIRSGDGYLFFVIPSLNIIIYPHDDIGFGSLYINKDKPYKAGQDFIRDVIKFNSNFSYSLRQI